VQKVQNEPCNWLAAKLKSDDEQGKNPDEYIYIYTAESLAEYKEIMGKTNFNCRQS